jgi:16S rRNA (guanine(966)-N(2))-methyltransferase RsmD
MVGSKIPGARVLDPMAGSGAMGFEALSRGAAKAVLADRSLKAIAAIKENAERLKAQNQTIIIKASQLKDFDLLTPHGPFDLLFLDPPYADLKLPLDFLALAAQKGLAAPEATAVWEQAPKTLAAWDPEAVAPWRVVVARAWGDRAAAILTLG